MSQTPEERWLPTRYPDYEISTLGRARKANGLVLRPQCVAKRGRFPVVKIKVHGTKKLVTIKSLVAEAFLPKPAGAIAVFNRNSNLADNRVENLFWASKIPGPKERLADPHSFTKYEVLA